MPTGFELAQQADLSGSYWMKTTENKIVYVALGSITLCPKETVGGIQELRFDTRSRYVIVPLLDDNPWTSVGTFYLRADHVYQPVDPATFEFFYTLYGPPRTSEE